MSDRRVIWKYPVTLLGTQHAIPAGATFLDAQLQDGVPTMWWSVPIDETHDPSAWPLRTFEIVGTGPPGYVADVLHYVATVQDPPFVWHIMSYEPVPR